MTGLTTESLLRIRVAVVEEENAKLREALDTLRNECTSELGSPEDYLKALKKADAALMGGEK